MTWDIANLSISIVSDVAVLGGGLAGKVGSLHFAKAGASLWANPRLVRSC